ncbi:hypothetical protein D3C85_519020 [compost metagenome]
MRWATSLTRAVVAAVAPLVKLMVSTPPVLVKVAKESVPDCRLPPLTLKSAPERSKPRMSVTTAVPLRCTVRVAPLQLFNASNSVSPRAALPPESRVTVLPTPAQATLSPLRLPMVGGALST